MQHFPAPEKRDRLIVRRKLMIRSACLFVLSLIALNGQIPPREVSSLPRTIRAAIERAKRSGKTTAEAPVVTGEYPLVATIEDALRLTTPVTVQVLEKETTLSQDGNTLLTLYAARIVDNISGITLADVSAKPDHALLPLPAFGTPAGNMLYVLVQGGATTIDGVAIAVPERPAPLLIGNDYLLFLRLERNRDGTPIRLATLPIGDAGIFRYDTATDAVGLVSKGYNNKELASKLMKTSGGFYSSLRAAIVAEEERMTSGAQR